MQLRIRVREADVSDRETLMTFHRSLYVDHRDQVVPKDELPLIEYRDYEHILHNDLRALLADRDSHVLIAEDQGVAVGYITGRVTVEPERVLPRRGVVEDWYVVPAARGVGVGARLLRSLEDRFREAGCDIVESATWAANLSARRIHDELGFREIRVIYRKRL
jgi:ribosomal protein S18 acetylase RimI-like enzyme